MDIGKGEVKIVTNASNVAEGSRVVVACVGAAVQGDALKMARVWVDRADPNPDPSPCPYPTPTPTPTPSPNLACRVMRSRRRQSAARRQRQARPLTYP